MAVRRQWHDAWTEPAVADDHALVRLAQANAAAFGDLYRRYLDPVYRYCSRQLDQTAAEDVTSIVFLKALQAIGSFDPDRATFRSWLFTIAHHAIIDQHRVRTHLPIDEIERSATGPSVEEISVHGDQMRHLRAALRTLPADQQAVINLRLADLTGVEIAAVLEKPPGTVRVLQHRAVQTLKRLLSEPEWSTDHD